jgi:PleD family two-component response regulator
VCETEAYQTALNRVEVKFDIFLVDQMPQVCNEYQACKKVRPKESLLHELELEVVQEVGVVFAIPNIHDYFSFAETSVLWFVFVPNRPSFVNVGES